MTKYTVLVARRTRSKSKKSRSAPASAAAGIYAVHPGIAMVQKWIDDLPAKTGRSLAEWLTHIRKSGPKDEKQSRDWLAAEYKLGTNTAWWLAEKAFGGAAKLAEDTPEGYLKLAPLYVERMYAGVRELLRPIHDELIELARGLSDVRICPCQTMVPLFRRHVFAQIKPATNKRIDLGLALGEEPFTTRLLDTGGRLKMDRITHKVMLTSPDDIDLQVKRWLKQAYERDG
jgi:hypothetical protein